jgi:predicted kinase
MSWLYWDPKSRIAIIKNAHRSSVDFLIFAVMNSTDSLRRIFEVRKIEIAVIPDRV